MSITWSQARTKLRGDLWRTSTGVPDDVCDRALHASLLELEGERRWLWLQGLNTTLTMATAAADLAAPADLSSVSALAYLSGTSGYDILGVQPLSHVRQASRGASAGAPGCYALHGGRFYFDTIVATGDDFELIYTARTPRDLTAAVAAGDGNATLDREETAIIANACHYVSLGYLKNEENAARHRAVFERHLQRLFDEEDEARGDEHGGCIAADTFYRDAAQGFG